METVHFRDKKDSVIVGVKTKQTQKCIPMHLSKTKTDVIIDETIDRIKTHAGYLRLYIEDNKILSDIPIYQISSIIIHGTRVNIPASLIKLCATEKIPVYIITDLYKHYGSLHFTIDSQILNRQSQYKAILDESWRLYLAKQILHQKLKTQEIAIKYWKNIPTANPFLKYSEKIDKAKKFQSLMGVEGSAAVDYWQNFGWKVSDIQSQTTKKSQFDWPGRQKHPTTDPINSMLSLAYGLLATQCQTTLSINGLDPYLGILHMTNPNRPALTYDIMEIYRVLLVDFWVLGLIQDSVFDPVDFTQTKEGICTLLPHKKNDFFRLWFKRLKYYKFNTNQGDMTIHDFLSHNTELLIAWFEKINSHKERNTGRFDKLPERLLVFEDIKEFFITNIKI